MKRQTTEFTLPPTSIGTRSTVLFHDYHPTTTTTTTPSTNANPDLEWFAQDRAYIQASLHADELPGLLVCHHLIKLLDVAAGEGRIKKQITIVPYANPVGLNQVIQGKHFGRFSLLSGINFNRNWLDVTEKVAKRLEETGLRRDDSRWNTALIRKALYEEASGLESNKAEVLWKRELYKKACTASIVLDLHCDADAIMHLYTHDRLWPEFADLASSIESKCNLLAPESGGNPFDEAYSCPWVSLASKFSSFPIDLACHSATIELRGEYDVSDELASQDAKNLYAFLVRRGYVEDNTIPPLTNLANQVATPLAGVDMMPATAPGILAWKVKAGDLVEKDQLLGEIVNIEDVDAPRIPIIARTGGLIYGMTSHKLAVPGDICIKVAGTENLEWRKGYLLNA
eukprot:gene1272-1346_t